MIYDCRAKAIVFKTGLENVHNLEIIFVIDAVFTKHTAIQVHPRNYMRRGVCGRDPVTQLF